jgi:hypothetical protein
MMVAERTALFHADRGKNGGKDRYVPRPGTRAWLELLAHE